jgi:hypothetical protein
VGLTKTWDFGRTIVQAPLLDSFRQRSVALTLFKHQELLFRKIQRIDVAVGSRPPLGKSIAQFPDNEGSVGQIMRLGCLRHAVPPL